ncbi:uncharacterized protein LOC111100780 isoform X2 [Crassostrea virginica]
MKGVFTCLWIYFHIIDCCSLQDHGYIDNAFLSCQTNDTCEAECYRGFIFPSGKTKTVYSCQQDLSGILSSCIRIPTVHIEYMATWIFINIPPKACDDISLLLNHTETVLEDVLRLCNTTAVDFNMTFSYRTLAFTVSTIFTGKYYSFKSTAILNKCVSLHLGYIKNQTSPLIISILDTITCLNETYNYTLVNDWHISDLQRQCPSGTEVKNVTVFQSKEDNIEYYCHSETNEISTDSSKTTSFQNSTIVATSLTVNNNTPANFTVYLAAPILGIAFLFVIISTMLCYKMRSRALRRQQTYQTILNINDKQANELTNDFHNYDVMTFTENSIEFSRY